MFEIFTMDRSAKLWVSAAHNGMVHISADIFLRNGNMLEVKLPWKKLWAVLWSKEKITELQSHGLVRIERHPRNRKLFPYMMSPGEVLTIMNLVFQDIVGPEYPVVIRWHSLHNALEQEHFG